VCIEIQHPTFRVRDRSASSDLLPTSDNGRSIVFKYLLFHDALNSLYNNYLYVFVDFYKERLLLGFTKSVFVYGIRRKL
jgi:hypothetical protein